MKQYLRQWLAWLVMLAGVCLLSGPFIAGTIGEYQQNRVVRQFEQQLEAAADYTVPAPASAIAMEQTAVRTPEPEKEAVSPEPTVTPEPTGMPQPTAAPEPTVTPEPAAAPEPTSAPVPTASPAPTAAPAPSARPSVKELPSASPAPAVRPVPTASPTPAEAPVYTLAPQEETELTPLEAFIRDSQEYNDLLIYNALMNMNSRADLEYFPVRANTYGIRDNLIGTVEIPRLGIELGLYLGASESNMAKGLAVFGQTSVPLGRESENCSIAGHRGWNGTPVFRDIQQMMIDDPIYLKTLWGTLEYRVCELRIVTPEDNTWCAVQEGRTLITLMTCHPYGHNYQRYIVFAELYTGDDTDPARETVQKTGTKAELAKKSTLDKLKNWFGGMFAGIGTAEPTPAPAVSSAPAPQEVPAPAVSSAPVAEAYSAPAPQPSPAAASAAPECIPEAQADGQGTALTPQPELPERTAVPQLPTVQQVIFVREDGTKEILEIDTTSITPGAEEYGTGISNLVILAEDKMRPIAVGSAIFVGLVGIWLAIDTARGINAEKKRKNDEG